jgi:hypothetical protein
VRKAAERVNTEDQSADLHVKKLHFGHLHRRGGAWCC